MSDPSPEMLERATRWFMANRTAVPRIYSENARDWQRPAWVVTNADQASLAAEFEAVRKGRETGGSE